MVVEGWKDSSGRFADSARESVEMPEIDPSVLVRVDGALDFTNIRHVRQGLFQVLCDHPAASCMVLDLSSCNSIDGSALTALEDLIRDLGEADVLVVFAEPRPRVLEKMERAGLIDVLGEDLWFDSKTEAVEKMRARGR